MHRFLIFFVLFHCDRCSRTSSPSLHSEMAVSAPRSPTTRQQIITVGHRGLSFHYVSVSPNNKDNNNELQVKGTTYSGSTNSSSTDVVTAARGRSNSPAFVALARAAASSRLHSVVLATILPLYYYYYYYYCCCCCCC